MMYHEFTERTGFYPDANLYRTIEEAYYDFDGDKNEFCKAYRANKDGLAERIARATNDAARLEHRKAEEKLFEAHDDLLEAQDKIYRLEQKVDRLLEWKPYTDERAVSQEKYDHLKSSGHEMTDEEAKQWIADEWGFAERKIEIIRTMPKLEISRMHTLRTVGEIARDPYYDATDWYYVRFLVCGMTTEAYNGSLEQI